MSNVTISVKHVASQRDETCAVCAATFVPSEDSGSRVFSLKASDREPFAALMCGGCYSKWSHGKTVTIHQKLG
jgi:hypothetical protein